MMNQRINLKIERVKNNLTQQQLAEKLGVSVGTYNLIENGKRRGSISFWNNIQKEFKLSGEEMWKLQQ